MEHWTKHQSRESGVSKSCFKQIFPTMEYRCYLSRPIKAPWVLEVRSFLIEQSTKMSGYRLVKQQSGGDKEIKKSIKNQRL